MKTKFAALALLISATLCCNNSFGHDLLHRMLGRGGCGCESASTCCDTPAPACGVTDCCEMTMPGRGLLAGLGSRLGCGCRAKADDCGCDAPVADCGCEVAPAADCGCDAGCGGGGGGLLSGRLQGLRCGGCGLFKGGIGNGCGCNLMESTPCADACQEVEACGCDAAPVDDCGCGGGLLSHGCRGRLFNGRLLDRLGNIGCGCCRNKADCGCAEAPADDCGCDAPVVAPAPSCGCEASAPVADCGCDDAPACGCGRGGLLQGRSCGLLSRVHDRGCGCDQCAAATADCGCDTGCGCDSGCGCDRHGLGLLNGSRRHGCGCGNASNDCGCGSASNDCCDGRGRLTLRDKLRGNRIPESSRYCNCGDGCNPPCPNQCGAVAPTCGCGGGYSVAPMTDGSSVLADPGLAPTYNVEGNVVAPGVEGNVEAPATEGNIVVPAGDGARKGRAPVIDPNAFIIRGVGYRN